ncbi:LysO family transporter [uncultured Bacteroides sp.]|uniref:LysO family transporter n=1 Tax=uncultured Bacteroides sp. TaxID=162156 RepID=UPI00260EEFC5|nr:LysO family transporter [uncultured Bacteroides sp.]
MFTVITIMFIGMGLGFLLRKWRVPGTNNLIMGLIWLLLFLLGIEVGSNRRIIEGIGTLGVEAALITIICVLGSCIFAWGLWKIITKKKES